MIIAYCPNIFTLPDGNFRMKLMHIKLRWFTFFAFMAQCSALAAAAARRGVVTAAVMNYSGHAAHQSLLCMVQANWPRRCTGALRHYRRAPPSPLPRREPPTPDQRRHQHSGAAAAPLLVCARTYKRPKIPCWFPIFTWCFKSFVVHFLLWFHFHTHSHCHSTVYIFRTVSF